ncbi:hypothetical protein B0H63DRAFT_200530 [Podospora didyma]|uniref:Uncharacterized protein n=1 Tax=Podospora didyma TaxID=330526 RepID=A0AAE0TVX0_9PEZI|nr:hypothetical protein B0H63DRAFT_200530 [Podospora didyma]
MEARPRSAVNLSAQDPCFVCTRPRPPGACGQIPCNLRFNTGFDRSYHPSNNRLFNTHHSSTKDFIFEFFGSVGWASSFFQYHEKVVAIFQSYGAPNIPFGNDTIPRHGPISSTDKLGCLRYQFLGFNASLLFSRSITCVEAGAEPYGPLPPRERYPTPSLGNSSGTPFGNQTDSHPNHDPTDSNSSLPSGDGLGNYQYANSHNPEDPSQCFPSKLTSAVDGLHNCARKPQNIVGKRHISGGTIPPSPVVQMDCSPPRQSDDGFVDLSEDDGFQYGEQDYADLPKREPHYEKDNYWEWNREKEQFYHKDNETGEDIWCPKSFD